MLKRADPNTNIYPSIARFKKMQTKVRYLAILVSRREPNGTRVSVSRADQLELKAA
jgi:hypothetical protein